MIEVHKLWLGLRRYIWRYLPFLITQEKGDIEWSQEATTTKKKIKADKGIFFKFLNTKLIITLWNLLSQGITSAKSMGRMQRKD